MKHCFMHANALFVGGLLLLAGSVSLPGWAQETVPMPVGLPPETLSLMSRLPESTLFVAAYDFSEENPSVRFARTGENADPDDRKAWEVMRRDIRESFSRILRLFGQDVELYENLREAMGTRAVLAVLPGPKRDAPPNVLFLAAVQDRERAAELLHRLISSFARNATEVTRTRGDAQIHTWTGFYGSKFTLHYLLGDGIAAISNNSDLLTPDLAQSGGTPPEWLRRLASTLPQGLLNAYVSPSIMDLLPKGRKGPDAAEIGFDGQGTALGLTEDGLLLTQATLIGEEGLLSMALGGAANVPGITEPAFPHLPSNSLLALKVSAPAQWLKSLGAAAMFLPMMAEDKESATGFQRIVNLFDGDVTLGLRALLPLPSALATVQGQGPESAEKKLAAVLSMLQKNKINVRAATLPVGRTARVIDMGKGPLSSVLLEVQGNALVAATDRRTLVEAARPDGGADSLSESDAYREVRRYLGENPRVLMYADLQALSGAGMFLSHIYFPGTPMGRYLASGFREVRGVGSSVEFGENSLTSRTFISGDPQKLLPALTSGAITALPVAAGLALPAIAKMREQAQFQQCTNQQRQLANAILAYAEDHDGRLPRANAWVQALKPYVEDQSVFHCPADPQPGTSYAMNMKLSGVNLNEVESPSETVLFYETTKRGASPHGTGEDQAFRHGGRQAVAFLDGHTEAITEPLEIEAFRLQKNTRGAPAPKPTPSRRSPAPAKKAPPKR
ncbi:MAG: hypothetical protein KY468_10395 [Armatimonadetes bacterium]|nr:hypothetical protein [Armatimonadota bacterium]